MAGRGPAPRESRRRANAPQRGDYAPAPGTGWQHGAPPAPPAGLLKASKGAWATWLAAWFAAHWTPDDVPGLRQVVRLYDQVERGEYQRASELRLQMDTYGITPKGQQDRRWMPPKADEAAPIANDEDDPYSHLRVVS